jgi:cyanate lyase
MTYDINNIEEKKKRKLTFEEFEDSIGLKTVNPQAVSKAVLAENPNIPQDLLKRLSSEFAKRESESHV